MEWNEERAKFLMSAVIKEWHCPERVPANIGIKKGLILADLGLGPWVLHYSDGFGYGLQWNRFRSG